MSYFWKDYAVPRKIIFTCGRLLSCQMLISCVPSLIRINLCFFTTISSWAFIKASFIYFKWPSMDCWMIKDWTFTCLPRYWHIDRLLYFLLHNWSLQADPDTKPILSLMPANSIARSYPWQAKRSQASTLSAFHSCTVQQHIMPVFT